LSSDIEAIDRRFRELISEGEEHVRAHSTPGESVNTHLAHGWTASVLNLIHLVTRGNGAYYEQAVKTSERAVAIDDSGKSSTAIVLTASNATRMHGLLVNIYKDWQSGLLWPIEYVVSAENFDQFLRQAGSYHKSGKKIEAAVLVAAVFEDALKKVAKRNGLDPSSRNAQDIIIDLREGGFITEVHARRLLEGTALRNKATHAKWAEFDLRDVGSVIRTVDELIEKHLNL